jgi:hypothetical protein
MGEGSDEGDVGAQSRLRHLVTRFMYLKREMREISRQSRRISAVFLARFHPLILRSIESASMREGKSRLKTSVTGRRWYV